MHSKVIFYNYYVCLNSNLFILSFSFSFFFNNKCCIQNKYKFLSDELNYTLKYTDIDKVIYFIVDSSHKIKYLRNLKLYIKIEI